MQKNEINTWSKIDSWQFVTPPSRPTKWQLDICQSILSTIDKKCNIAVLGSTIEFRNLLVETGFKNVFIFERNRSFYDYTSKYIQKKENEIYIDGNWLETLSNYNDTFEVVLSDLTSGNIDYMDREKLYLSISTAMSRSGLFVDRILTKPIPFLELSGLISKYSSLPLSNENVNSFSCEVLFCSTLLNNKACIVDSSYFYDYLLALNIPRISQFVIECYKITPRDCIWWYSKDWKEEKNWYDRFFQIKASYDEPKSSEYYHRTKLFISNKVI